MLARAKVLMPVAVFVSLVTCAASQQYQVTVMPTPGGYGTPWPQAISGGIIGGHIYLQGSSDHHAFTWDTATAQFTDRHPLADGSSTIFGMGAQRAVGYIAGTATGGKGHAALWAGSQVTDLHPIGHQHDNSYAQATDGAQQVGRTFSAAPPDHAALWSGTAESYVNLNPPGATGSVALDVDNERQVGSYSGPMTGDSSHGVMWRSSASDYTDLHPTGYQHSWINGIRGDEQAGVAMLNNSLHATVWHGSVPSFIDLSPSGFAHAEALGTNGTTQVGWARRLNTEHGRAYAWNGTPESAIDLHQFVTHNYTDSTAFGIDEFGNIAGWVSDGTYWRAAVWSPVPEASTILTISVLLLLLLVRHQHRN